MRDLDLLCPRVVGVVVIVWRGAASKAVRPSSLIRREP